MSALDEAREVLGHTGGFVGTPEQVMALAQIHATLAVAEQLQLSNLIAMETAEWETGIRFTPDMHALASIDREDPS